MKHITSLVYRGCTFRFYFQSKQRLKFHVTNVDIFLISRVNQSVKLLKGLNGENPTLKLSKFQKKTCIFRNEFQTFYL